MSVQVRMPVTICTTYVAVLHPYFFMATQTCTHLPLHNAGVVQRGGVCILYLLLFTGITLIAFSMSTKIFHVHKFTLEIGTVKLDIAKSALFGRELNVNVATTRSSVCYSKNRRDTGIGSHLCDTSFALLWLWLYMGQPFSPRLIRALIILCKTYVKGLHYFL